MKRRMPRLTTALVAIAAATLLATSGCSTSPQMAFSVGDDVTTIDQVSSLAEGCATALGGTTEIISASGLVSDMIHVALARQIAQANGIQFSDDELRQPIDAGAVSPLAQMMLKDPSCAQLALGLTLQVLVVDQLGVSNYQSIADKIPVSINPRFGTWNPADLTVDGSGSLSQTDADATN